MHSLRKDEEFFFGEGAVELHTEEEFDFENTEIGFGDVEDTRKDRVVVAKVIIIFRSNHHPNHIQLFDRLVIDKSFARIFLHTIEIDKRNSQTFNSTRGILDDVLDGSSKRRFVTFAGAMERGCSFGGLDGANFS